MNGVASSLVDKALSPATHKTYQRAVQQYVKFIEDVFDKSTKPFPASSQCIMLFVAHCYDNNLAASTVLTYVSALSYFHKIRGWTDTTQNFVVKKCLQGYQKERPSSDQRKPITVNILLKLIESLNHTTSSHFTRVLLRAMFLLAFHAMLRVGEFTVKSSFAKPILKAEDVVFKFNNSAEPFAFELKLTGYKHSQGRTTTLFIEQNKNVNICPVRSLWSYFKVTGFTTGPIFSFMDGAAVTRHFFTQQLQLSLLWADCSTQLYKNLSLRIGRATVCAAQGMSMDEISRIGRWSSSAVKNYIRMPMINA